MSPSISLEERKTSWKRWDIEYRKDIDDIAAEGDENTLDVTIKSHIWSMIQRAQDPELSAFQDTDYHLFCYTVIQAAKSYTFTNSKQNEVVLHLICAREIGTVELPIVDPISGVQTLVPCTSTTGARVPSDLPFLVEDIEEEWMNRSSAMSIAQRTNLMAFIGRLLAVGISNRLSLCALRLFHDALETPRRLRESEPGQEVPILDLLPAIDAWLIVHNYKTHTMVRRGYEFDTPLAAPGELAQSAGITKNGFSRERWMFWKSRLQEIGLSMSPDEKKRPNFSHMMERLGDESVRVFVPV
jgi:hypothetical protein